MSRGIPSRLGLLRCLACLAAAAPFSCLREAPYVDPENVYDAEEAIRRAHLEGLDSVAIFLVDVRDSTRRILLWSGHPDAGGKISPYQGRDGEDFFFLVQGFRRDRGPCFLEHVGSEGSRVLLDTCEARLLPKLYTLDSVITLMKSPTDPTLILWTDSPPRESLWLALSADKPWVRPERARIQLARVPLYDKVPHRINWDDLPPGPQEATLRVHAGDSLLATVKLRIAGALARSRILGGDTLRAGLFPSGWSGTVILPDLPRDLAGSQWSLVKPEGAPFNMKVQPNMEGPPGARRVLEVNFTSGPLPREIIDRTWPIQAVKRDGTVLDSLMVAFERPADFAAAGKIIETGGNLVRNARVLLDDRTMTTSDSNGIFHFKDLEPGDHRIHLIDSARITPTLRFRMDPSGWSEVLTVSVSRSIQFQEISLGAELGEFGPAAYSQGWYGGFVIASRGREGGEVYVTSDGYSPGTRSVVRPLRNYFSATDNRTTPPSNLVAMDLALLTPYPHANRLGKIENWNSIPEYKSIPLGFSPYAVHAGKNLLAIAGVDSLQRMVLGLHYADGTFLRNVILPASWTPAPGAVEGGPRIWGCDTVPMGTDSAARSARYQVTVPGNDGGAGKLIQVTAGFASERIEAVDLDGDPTGIHDGIVGLGGGTPKAYLQAFDGNLVPRVFLPKLESGVRDLSVPPLGTRSGLMMLVTAQDKVFFLEIPSQRLFGPFRLPAGAIGRRVALSSNGPPLVLSGNKAYRAEF